MAKPMGSSENKQDNLVSVLMNCFNGEEFVTLAIESVLSQSYKNWELIFIDNASTDKTSEILQNFSNDKRIKYTRNVQKEPLGAARNMGLSLCSGKYIAFLDSDDLWEKDKLQSQVQILETQSDVAFVYSNFTVLTGNPNDSINTLRAKYWLPRPSGHVFSRFLREYPANMQTVIVRRSVLVELNLEFDSSLHLAEEFYFFMMILHKYKAQYQSKVTAGYRSHANQDSVTKLSLYPIEASYIINQFKENIDGFLTSYREEINFFEAKIRYYKARVQLRNGETSKALDSLRQAGAVSFKLRCLYWTLRCSPYMFTAVHKISNRYI